MNPFTVNSPIKIHLTSVIQQNLLIQTGDENSEILSLLLQCSTNELNEPSSTGCTRNHFKNFTKAINAQSPRSSLFSIIPIVVIILPHPTQSIRKLNVIHIVYSTGKIKTSLLHVLLFLLSTLNEHFADRFSRSVYGVCIYFSKYSWEPFSIPNG